MRSHTVAARLAIGLVLSCVRVAVAGSTSATDAHFDLVSPYQPYELELSSFCPVPGRSVGVFLHVRINGVRPLRLVLDSGADSIVIGAKAAHSLGLSGRIRNGFGRFGNETGKSVHGGERRCRSCFLPKLPRRSCGWQSNRGSRRGDSVGVVLRLPHATRSARKNSRTHPLSG